MADEVWTGGWCLGGMVLLTGFSSAGIILQAAVEAEIRAAAVQQPEAVCLIISSPNEPTHTLPVTFFGVFFMFWVKSQNTPT